MLKQALLYFLLFELVRNALRWYTNRQLYNERLGHQAVTTLTGFEVKPVAPVRLHVSHHKTAGAVAKQYTEYVLEVRSKFCFDSSTGMLSLSPVLRQHESSLDLAAERRVRSFLQQHGLRIETNSSPEFVHDTATSLQNETLVLTWLSRAAHFNPAHFAGEWLSAWALLRECVAKKSETSLPIVLWRPAPNEHRPSPLAACETEHDHGSVFCVFLHTMVAEYSLLQALPKALRRDTRLCGTRLLIPGLLKSRFFRSQEDAIAWREAVLRYLGVQDLARACRPCADPNFPRHHPARLVERPQWQRPQPRLCVTYLRRGAQTRSDVACRRRCLANEDQMIALLRRYRGVFHYDLRVVEASANDTTLASVRHIVDTIHQSHVLISLHGAQLVYATLLPPWRAALIEILPFGFRHDMYAHGGGAPIHYFSIEGDPPFSGGAGMSSVDDTEPWRPELSLSKTNQEYRALQRIYQRDQAVSVPLRALRNALEIALETIRNEPCGCTPAAA